MSAVPWHSRQLAPKKACQFSILESLLQKPGLSHKRGTTRATAISCRYHERKVCIDHGEPYHTKLAGGYPGLSVVSVFSCLPNEIGFIEGNYGGSGFVDLNFIAASINSGTSSTPDKNLPTLYQPSRFVLSDIPAFVKKIGLEIQAAGVTYLNMSKFPAYDDLRVIAINGQQKRCAWGLFDKDGKKDVYGCLNKVTPDIVAKAAAHVTDGVTISLNLPLAVLQKPGFGRKQFVHKVLSFVDSPLQIHGFDDEVEFNTQCSSQWDALCHFYDQDIKRGYNDANPKIEDLAQNHDENQHVFLPTLNHWHARGGLATRGVLIDYKAYADKKGIDYSPLSAHKITIADIEDVAREQGVRFEQGDIFLLRTGYTEAIQAATEEEQGNMITSPDNVGVEGTMDAVKWFWNQHFSAVAADNTGFEVMRPTKNGIDASGTTADYVLHPNFLSLLGLHIGELWDFRMLSEYCHKTRRFTFMLTSMPLNFSGACGSPPNAMAIF